MKFWNKYAILILSFSFIIRILFAFYTPNWQSSDEYPHFFVIKYLNTFNQYPISDNKFPAYEALQPPLYYYIANILYQIVKSYDSPSPALNEIFDPDTLTHPPNIALITIRLFSVFLGMLTLLLIYKISFIFFKDSLAIYTLLIAGTLPSFVVNSSSLTNDSLANLIGAIIIFLLIRKIEKPHFKIKDSILLGFVLGFGLITKVNLYPFIPIILIALFLYPITLKKITTNYIVILLISLIISAFYFYTNILKYGTLLPILQATEKENIITLSNLFHSLRNYFWSFWAAAGRIYQIHLEPIHYILIFFPFTLLAIAGNIKYIFTPRVYFDNRQYTYYLFFSIILIFILSALFYSLFYANNSSWGRFVYPSLATYLIIFVYGIFQIIKEKYAGILMIVLSIIQTLICIKFLKELVEFQF